MKAQAPLYIRGCLVLLCALSALWNVRCAAAGYALQFTNGSIQSVGVMFVPELNMYPFTVTAWIKAGAQPSDPMFQPTPILTKGNTFDGWTVSIYNGEIRASYVANPNYVSDGPPVSSSGLNGGAVGDDQWHHVAFTVDASGGKIYVDGVLRTNTAWSGVPATNQFAHPIFFGHGQFSGAQYVGLLDEVTLWNTALTQAQIQTNKNRLLTGQEPGLIAYYRLDESVGPHSLDSAPAGGTNTGFWNNVTPVLSDSPIARVPVVQTFPASSVGGTGATLNGLVNPQGANTSAWFEWGTTTNYGNITPEVFLPAVTNELPFLQGITGLAIGTTYHFRGVASNSSGVAWGTNVSFTTMSGPSVTTLPASAVVATNAMLNGSVNPNGTVSSAWFEWGTTTNYGNITAAQAVGAGMSFTNFSQALGGLVPGPTYHFRAVASNSLGIGYGINQTFFSPAFTNLTTSFPGVERSAVAWGDYDNDGRLDLLISGYSSASGISQVWRNTGGSFSNINAGLTGLQYSSVAWGDYDNDGRLDFLLTGAESTIMQFWRNTGSGFTNLSVGLPNISATIDWGDYDRDGRLDLLLGGGSFLGNAPPLWRNVSALFGNGGFVDANTSLPRVGGVSSSVKWGDFDGDGWLDALVAGDSNSTNTTQLWRNYHGSFSYQSTGFPALRSGVVAWGDYDNDGRPDLILTGNPNNSGPGGLSQVWRNTGNGFTNINAGLPGVSVSSAAWGDYDNDGRLDLLLCGTTNSLSSGAICQLWRNTINGFTLVNVGFPGILSGAAAWGDYNNDGRLDIALVGSSPTAGRVAQVWVNQMPPTNTPPLPPTGLHAVVENNSVVLKWNAATDAQTPSSGLTYNVRIGTTPGGSDVVAPMSDPTGLRRLPHPGNAHQSLRWPVDNLPLNRVLYWSVQAVDTAFAGSAFSAGSTFKLLYAPPALVPLAATTPIVGDTNGDGILDESEKNAVLANYFANSPWLMMTNVAGLGGTNVDFSLTNNLSGAFSVEYSTNLTDWYFLGPAIPRYQFTDTNAPALPQRSYRLRWP